MREGKERQPAPTLEPAEIFSDVVLDQPTLRAEGNREAPAGFPGRQAPRTGACRYTPLLSACRAMAPDLFAFLLDLGPHAAEAETAESNLRGFKVVGNRKLLKVENVHDHNSLSGLG